VKQAWIILTVMVFLGIGASGAWAQQSHAHHHGIDPFKMGKIEQKAHCLLHHHRYPTQICPHHQHNPDSPIQELASDCGGTPAGTLPYTSFQGAPVFLISGNDLISYSSASGNAPSSRFLTTTLYYALSPPPPEFI